MIASRWLGALTVAAPSTADGSRQLSAASGLVKVGDFFYVVTDDENFLAAFRADGAGEGRLVRLFPGELPLEPKARKARKPDLEALALVPACPAYPSGALLAVPSGSRPNRRSGSVLALDAVGGLVGAPRPVDFSQLYLALEQRLPELNIEGAVVADDALVLLQRGSRKQPLNACIRVPLAAIGEALAGTGNPGQPGAISMQFVDLGRISGALLSFTDAAALGDGRILFTAVAEDAADSYQDGACAGSAVGILGVDGRVQYLEQLDHPYKIEGVHAELDGDSIRLLLVTDADDAAVPSDLRSARLSPPAAPAVRPGPPA
jgi:hypothetical protein